VPLPRESRRIVRKIKREVRSRSGEKAFDTRKERRRAIRGGIATGLVESNLTNIRGGHADSSGWRQERESIYPDPNNLNASIDRFFNEWAQHARPGLRAGDIAANVQRPAAAYRGRYQERIRSGEVDRIRKSVQVGGAVSPEQQQRKRLAARMGMQGASAFDAGMAEALGLGGAALPPQALVPGASIPEPSFSARAVMPEGYGGAISSGAPGPRSSLADALQLGGGMDVSFGGAGGPQMGGGNRNRRGGRGGRGGLPGSPERLGDWVSEFAQRELGLSAGSRDRGAGENAAVGGSSTSDHLSGPGFKGREAVDIPTTDANGGWGQYRKMVKALGLKPARGGFTEGVVRVGRKGRRVKVQVIYGAAHGHGDHIHVGFHRAD
jgi:hypothetical protein